MSECQNCGAEDIRFVSATYTRNNPSHDPVRLSPAKRVCNECGETVERLD